jgi:translation initiation factor 2D
MNICTPLLASVRHPAVTRYLCNGSDLMLPGVADAAAEGRAFREGELFAVAVPGNPKPVALGVTSLNSAAVAVSGDKGKLLEVINCWGDALTALAEGDAAPNAGFQSGRGS